MHLAVNQQEAKSDMGVLVDQRITTYTFDRNLHVCAEQGRRQMHGKHSEVDGEERDGVCWADCSISWYPLQTS